jgi:tetratricopeptide (TPR) repeat protein
VKRSARTYRAPLALALAFGVVVTSHEAHAQPGDAGAPTATEDAGAHFERGVGFFRDHDYTAAMVEFKKAYELDPHYRVLFNLGQTSKELKDYAAALTSFERYLTEGGDKIDAERRKTVEGWVVELRDKVGRVTFKIEVAGADVAVDDIDVGKTPLDEPVVVNAGRRKITVMKPGYAPLTRFVDVAGTESKELALELVPLTAPPGEGDGKAAGGAPATSAPTEGGGIGPGPWVMLGVTGAAGIAAGVVGGLALGKKSDFDDALTKVPTSATEIDDARSSARTFAITADVLTGVAVAAGVTTIILFIVDASSGPSAPPTNEPTARVLVGPGFAGVSGSF